VSAVPDRAPHFRGARVALLEARLAGETAAMVRRLGGIPVPAPALSEHPVDADAEVGAMIDGVLAAPHPVVVFLTGVAVNRMFTSAERQGRDRDLIASLTRAVIVARGPKPVGALARRRIGVEIAVPAPYTTAEVITALQAIPVANRTVIVVHYGERNEQLVAALSGRGAIVNEIMLYEWCLPADTTPLSRAIDAILAGEISVLAITSQIQLRHLLQVAGPARQARLISVLNDRVVVGAVGPTCAAACAAAGITTPIVPSHPKLGPLLAELARRVGR
jgi:uroporphyrinogen-III synthase